MSRTRTMIPPSPALPAMSPHDLLAAELARRAREIPIEDLARLVMSGAPARRRRHHKPASGEFRTVRLGSQPAPDRPVSEAPASSGPSLRALVAEVIERNDHNPLTSAGIVRRVLELGTPYREPSIRSEISRQVSEGRAVRIGPIHGGVYRVAPGARRVG